MAFWVAFAVSSIGTGLALPYLGYYLHVIRGNSAISAGLLMGGFALANFCCAMLVGPLIDRFGGRRVLLAAIIVQFSGYMVLVPRWGGVGLGLALVTAGAGNGAFNASLPVVMRTLGPAEERTRLFVTNNVIFNLGLGIGAVAGAILTSSHQPETYSLAFLLNCCSYALFGLIAWIVLPQAVPGHETKHTAGRIAAALRDRRLCWLAGTASLTMVLGFAQTETAAPLLLQDGLGAPSGTVGAFVALNTLAVVLLQLPIARFGKRLAPEDLPIVLAMAWVAGACIVLLAARAGYGVQGLMVFAVVFAIGECLFSPSFPVLLLNIAPDGMVGRYSGIYAASFTGSGAAGNVVAVVAAGYLSFSGYWWAMAAGFLVLLATTIGLRRVMRGSTQDQEARP